MHLGWITEVLDIFRWDVCRYSVSLISIGIYHELGVGGRIAAGNVLKSLGEDLNITMYVGIARWQNISQITGLYGLFAV